MATKRQALGGQGLAALIADNDITVPRGKRKGTDAEQADSESAVLLIDIDNIKPNSRQPRKVFKEETMEELATSIEAEGVIQPILVTKASTGYEIIAGERRWRAARKAGLKDIPAIVREVTEEEKAKFAIIENIQREDLNTIDEAKAFRTLIDDAEMTHESLAKAVGKSRSYITNTLRTLTMPPEIVEMLWEGTLTLGHANALGAVKDADKQVRLAKQIAEQGSSVREAERMAAAAGSKKKAKPRGQKTARKTNEIRMAEQDLTSATGVKVVINGDEKTGSVNLHYYNKEGLDEIIDLLCMAGTK